MTRVQQPRRATAPAAESRPLDRQTPRPTPARTPVWNGFVTQCWPAAMLAAVASFLALPPVGWWPLVFLGPVGWLWLARRERLPGWRPYTVLWLSGFAFWLPTLHWLRLPHPATSIGWIALAFYLAFYIPVFVGLVRTAVHRHSVPIMVAAPMIWMGLELARGHLLTGFTMGSFGHAPYRWLEFIQVADIVGAYGVSAVVMALAAALACVLPCDSRRWNWRPILPAAFLMAAVLGYGYYRAGFEPERPGPKVALIQGSIDTTLKTDPKKQYQVGQHYFELSRRAVAEHRDLDLLVWPETMYRSAYLIQDQAAPPPNGWTKERLAALVEQRTHEIGDLARNLDVPLLLGVDTVERTAQGDRHYNSALFVGRDGAIGPRYDKMHPVLFGEYVPLGERFPWLYNLTPLGGGLTTGKGPEAERVAGAFVSPSICYETVIPHLIRRQVRELTAAGREPDLLVNVTNDGWFWGSSELDLHLMCGVFRAIECRKPLVIAANTGFSAWIDGNGRILAQGPRRAADVIVAETRLDGRRSAYLVLGDLPAGACLFVCGLLAVSGWRSRAKPLQELGAARL